MSEMKQYSIISEKNTKLLITSLDQKWIDKTIIEWNNEHNKFLLETMGITRPIANRYSKLED
jgi:hypothetical protein|tara:strand:+ start:739 stop:924 length:186 start_codon:yes stop_codon:yes gene_type:complete